MTAPWHHALRWPLYYQWPSARNQTQMEIRPDCFTFYKPRENDVKLLFCGDIMISNGDRTPLLHPDLTTLIQSTDLFIGNCESSVNDKSPNTKARYLFNYDMPQCYLSNIIYHVGNQSMARCLKTHNIFKEMGITAIGRHDDVLPLKIVHAGSFRIGFIAWTEGENCETFLSHEPGAFGRNHIVKHHWNRIKEIYHLDYLIGLPHWENELQHFPKKSTRELAKHLIDDLGIDFLIGIHTHTLQTMEWFNNGFCVYNIGNFYSQRKRSIKLIPILEIRLQHADNNQCKLAHYQLHYFYQQRGISQDYIIPLRSAPAKERMRIGTRIKKLYAAHDSLNEILRLE